MGVTACLFEDDTSGPEECLLRARRTMNSLPIATFGCELLFLSDKCTCINLLEQSPQVCSIAMSLKQHGLEELRKRIVVGQILQSNIMWKECVFYGDKYLREQKQTIDNPFWREVIESTYGLRLNIRPSWDYAFLS